MITILLADDHPVVRQGLEAILKGENDFLIKGMAVDGFEAISMAERVRPNILLVDLMMPGVNGIEVVRQIGQRAPDTRVILLSMYATESYVLEALKHGAWGYLLKEDAPEELIHAIRQVAAGRHYLSQPLSERATKAYADMAKGIPEDAYETLTAREREVFHLAAEGASNPQIAERLNISARTAETHRANVMRKLGLTTQTDLIRYAIRRGVIAVDP